MESMSNDGRLGRASLRIKTRRLIDPKVLIMYTLRDACDEVAVGKRERERDREAESP